jgi:uncharacterized protein YggE
MASGKWQTSPELEKKAKEELELTAIQWAKEKAKTLSDALDDRCKLEEIKFSNLHNITPRTVYMANQQRSPKAPLPKKEDLQLKLHANIEYECR